MSLLRLPFLRYFTVLAEELHFGRAAGKLAITQPTLSAAIKSLEDDLGVTLFERDRTRVLLTPAGAAFLAEVRHVLESVAKARNVAVAVASGMVGRLDIGFAGTLMLRGIPRILDAFAARAPGIEVALHEMSSSEQLERLRHGGLNAGFLYGAPEVPGLARIAMEHDSFVLCMPSKHPKADQAVVPLQEVAHEGFLMFRREVNPVNHDAVLAMFHRAGIYPRLVHSIRNWFTMIAMVSENRGLGIVCGSLARLHCAGVRMVALAGPPADAPGSLVWSRNAASPALRQFLACAQEVIEGSAEDARSS